MMMHLPMSLQFQCSLPRSTTRWQCFRPGSLSRRRAYEEAKAALDRAQELAVGAESAAARFPAYYGKWLSCSHRGEMDLARQIAERFLREAKVEGRMFEAAVASRILGVTFLWQGDFTEAKATLEETLRLCDAQQNPQVNVGFGLDTVAPAKAFLALTTWVLGEVTRARVLIEEALARAVETTHAPTLVTAYWIKATLEVLRGDAEGVSPWWARRHLRSAGPSDRERCRGDRPSGGESRDRACQAQADRESRRSCRLFTRFG